MTTGTYSLISNGEKYGGQYVATKSFASKEVICHGKELQKVYDDAKKQGIEEPVVFYVPGKDVVQIYKCQ